jgi:hypothetical protein
MFKIKLDNKDGQYYYISENIGNINGFAVIDHNLPFDSKNSYVCFNFLDQKVDLSDHNKIYSLDRKEKIFSFKLCFEDKDGNNILPEFDEDLFLVIIKFTLDFSSLSRNEFEELRLIQLGNDLPINNLSLWTLDERTRIFFIDKINHNGEIILHKDNLVLTVDINGDINLRIIHNFRLLSFIVIMTILTLITNYLN